MFQWFANMIKSSSPRLISFSPQYDIIYLFLILIKPVTILLVLLYYFTSYFYIMGSGKEEVLVRSAGLLPEPKYALDGHFSLVFKNVYTDYNQSTERHYFPLPYPYHNCDHITSTTMLFHTIFIYTGLCQGRGAGKRCRAIARVQKGISVWIRPCIYIYIYMYIWTLVRAGTSFPHFFLIRAQYI